MTSNIEDVSNQIQWNKYITHLFYMKDPKIEVEREYLESEKNISCIEVKREEHQDYYDLNDFEVKLRHIAYGN